MHTLNTGYRGLSLLVTLNVDRVLYAVTLAASLGAGAWLAGF